jgi:hypothetical protein
MKKNDDNWWDFVSKRDAPKRPAIPAYVPPPREAEPSSGMEVEESEGVDGSNTIIQKVKRFWGT